MIAIYTFYWAILIAYANIIVPFALGYILILLGTGGWIQSGKKAVCTITYSYAWIHVMCSYCNIAILLLRIHGSCIKWK